MVRALMYEETRPTHVLTADPMRRFSALLAVAVLAPVVLAAALFATDAIAAIPACCFANTGPDAQTVVYVEGDAGVALQGGEAVPHLNGAPADEAHVERVGRGLRIRDASGQLRAEVALVDGPGGLQVDWAWAPRPYYAVTFPAFGVRVAGRDGKSGLRITSVAEGTPAASVALRPGSRLLDVDDQPATPLALRAALDRTTSGTGVAVLRVADPNSDETYTVVLGSSAYTPK